MNLDANQPQIISSGEARDGLDLYIPLIKKLNDSNTDYCIVGGLAVMLHALSLDASRVRATNDIDIMVDRRFSNEDFRTFYLESYGGDPEFGKIIYEEIFGEGAFESLESLQATYINQSFLGVSDDAQGLETPNVDLVKSLNNESLETLETTTIIYEEIPIKVATIDQLIDMKEKTINLYRASINETSRPQDFAELSLLNQMKEIEHEISQTCEDDIEIDGPRL